MKPAWRACSAVGPAVAFLALAAGAAHTQEGPDPDTAADVAETEPCLACHVQLDGQFMAIGEDRLALHVDPASWAGSAHAGELGCTSCHADIDGYPHRPIDVPDLRAYQVWRAESCGRCHFAHYTRLLDGMHFRQREAGDARAPTCTDCHGAHGIERVSHAPLAVDRTCARCHAEVAAAYERSVHGAAMLGGTSGDVPVCTDCHGSHAILDPRTASFHAGEHEICASCHADAERMARYGLSPNVLDSYLADFHGASNEMYTTGESPERPLATCTDCHGVHDVRSLRAPGEAAAVQARVEAACARCHDDVPEGFGQAWLSHYEPTPATAPLVWAVQSFFRVLVPLLLIGLTLHILTDLWRGGRRVRA